MDTITTRILRVTSACVFNIRHHQWVHPHFPTLVEPPLKLVNSFLCLFGQSFPAKKKLVIYFSRGTTHKPSGSGKYLWF